MEEMCESPLTAKEKLKLFPWIKAVNRRFSKLLPANYDLETLNLFHREVEKELEIISISSSKKNEALFSTLICFYNHFCWKIKWNKPAPHMKSSCSKILSSLSKVGLVLSKGNVKSKWLNQVLSALKVFPGDNDSLYDALLHISRLKKKFQPAYSAVLSHILCSAQHRTEEPSTYFKLMFLFRRLKLLSKDSYERAEVVSLACRVATPLSTVSWLISNNLEELCEIKMTRIGHRLMGKKFSRAILEKLREVILPDMCMERSVVSLEEDGDENASIVNRFFIDSQPATENMEIIADAHTTKTKKKKCNKSSTVNSNEIESEPLELIENIKMNPDTNKQIIESKRKYITDDHEPTDSNASKKKKKIDSVNKGTEKKRSSSKQTLKVKERFAENEVPENQEIECAVLSDISSEVQSSSYSDFASKIDYNTPSNLHKKSKNKITHSSFLRNEMDENVVDQSLDNQPNSPFIVAADESGSSKKIKKRKTFKVTQKEIHSQDIIENQSNFDENDSMYFQSTIKNKINYFISSTPDPTSALKKKKKKRNASNRLSEDFQPTSINNIDSFEKNVTSERDASNSLFYIDNAPTTKRLSAFKNNLREKEQDSIATEKETSKNFEVENDEDSHFLMCDLNMERDSNRKKSCSNKIENLKKETTDLDLSVQNLKEDVSESSFKVEEQPTLMKISKRKRHQKGAVSTVENNEPEMDPSTPRKLSKQSKSKNTTMTTPVKKNIDIKHIKISNKANECIGVEVIKEFSDLTEETNSNPRPNFDEYLVEKTDTPNTEVTKTHSSSIAFESDLISNSMEANMKSDAEEPIAETEAVENSGKANNEKSICETESVESIAETEAVESTTETEAVESVAETEAVETIPETDYVESIDKTDESIAETEIVKNINETGIVDSIAETEAVEDIGGTNAEESTAETEAVEDIGGTNAEESTAETESVVSVETEAVETISKTESLQSIDETEAIDSFDNTEAVETIDKKEAIENIDEKEAIDTIVETKAVDIIDETEAVESIAETEIVETIDETETVDSIVETETVEKIDKVNAEESIAETKSVASIEIEAVETISETESVQSIDKTVAIDSFEAIETIVETKTLHIINETEAVESIDETDEYIDETGTVETIDETETVDSIVETEAIHYIVETVVKAIDETAAVETIDEIEADESIAIAETEAVQTIDKTTAVEYINETEKVEAVDGMETVETIDETEALTFIDESIAAKVIVGSGAVERNDEACIKLNMVESNTDSDAVESITKSDIVDSKVEANSVKYIAVPVTVESKSETSAVKSNAEEGAVEYNVETYASVSNISSLLSDSKEDKTGIPSLLSQSSSDQHIKCTESAEGDELGTFDMLLNNKTIEMEEQDARFETSSSHSDTNNLIVTKNKYPSGEVMEDVPVQDDIVYSVNPVVEMSINSKETETNKAGSQNRTRTTKNVYGKDIPDIHNSIQVNSVPIGLQDSIELTNADIQENPNECSSQVNSCPISSQATVEESNADISDKCNSTPADDSDVPQDSIEETDANFKNIPSECHSAQVDSVSDGTQHSTEDSEIGNVSEKFETLPMDSGKLISQSQLEKSITNLNSLVKGIFYEEQSSKPTRRSLSPRKKEIINEPSTKSTENTTEELNVIEKNDNLKKVNEIEDIPSLSFEINLNSSPKVTQEIIVKNELKNAVIEEGTYDNNIQDQNKEITQLSEEDYCKILLKEVRDTDFEKDFEGEITDESNNKPGPESRKDIPRTPFTVNSPEENIVSVIVDEAQTQPIETSPTMTNISASNIAADSDNKVSPKESETVESVAEALYQKILKAKEEKLSPNSSVSEEAAADILTENTVNYVMGKIIMKVECVDNGQSFIDFKSTAKNDIKFIPEQCHLPKLGNLSNLKPFGFPSEDSKLLTFVDVSKENIRDSKVIENSQLNGNSPARKKDFYPYRNLVAMEMLDDKSDSNFSDVISTDKLDETICVSDESTDSDTDDETMETNDDISESPSCSKKDVEKEIIVEDPQLTENSQPEDIIDKHTKPNSSKRKLQVTSTNLSTETSAPEESDITTINIANAETYGVTVEGSRRDSGELISLVQTIQVPIVNLGSRCDDESFKNQKVNSSEDFVNNNDINKIKNEIPSIGASENSEIGMEDAFKEQSPTNMCNQESKDTDDNTKTSDDVEAVITRKLRKRNVSPTGTEKSKIAMKEHQTPERSCRTRVKRKPLSQETPQSSEATAPSISGSLRRSSKRLKKNINMQLRNEFNELSLDSPKAKNCNPTNFKAGLDIEDTSVDYDCNVESLKVKRRTTRSSTTSVPDSKDCSRTNDEVELCNSAVEIENVDAYSDKEEDSLKRTSKAGKLNTRSVTSKITKYFFYRANSDLTPVNEKETENENDEAESVQSSTENLKITKRSTRSASLASDRGDSKTKAEPDTFPVDEEETDIERNNAHSSSTNSSKDNVKAARRSKRTASTASEKGSSKSKLSHAPIDEESDGENVDSYSTVSEESLKENTANEGDKACSKAETGKSSTRAYNLRSKRTLIKPSKLNILKKSEENHS